MTDAPVGGEIRGTQPAFALGTPTSIGSLPHRDRSGAISFVLDTCPELPAAPSLPRLDRRVSKTDRLHRITGQPPSLVHVPSGCAFHPRCPNVRLDIPCTQERPELREVDTSHLSACHFAEDIFAEVPSTFASKSMSY